MIWQKYFHFPQVIGCLQVQLYFIYIYIYICDSFCQQKKRNNLFLNSQVDISLFFVTQNIDGVKTSATVPKFTSSRVLFSIHMNSSESLPS